jgi:hypothetical protein
MDEAKTSPNRPDPKQETPSDPPATLSISQEKSPQNSDTAKAEQDKSRPNTNKQNLLFRLWGWIQRDTTSTDWAIVGLTAVIAITSYLQWSEIHAGGKDTHDLAEAAKTQAEKMKSMSDAADKIREASEGMVIQEKRIADNAQNSLDASTKQSKAALDATVSSFRNDQRAWIGIGDYRVDRFDDKQPFKMIIPWTNSGKSPAIEAEDWMLYQFSDKPILGPIATPQYVFEKIPALAPQGKYAMTLTNPEATARYDRIMNGTAYMAYFGIVRYRDVYSKTIHATTFCLVYDRETKQMTFCQSGNDMN